jgi:protein O-mannosyl-transferase
MDVSTKNVVAALRRSAPAVLLVLGVIFAYQPAWNAGFIWDDDDYVTHNPLLTAEDGLRRIWFSTDSPSQYFPLVYTTFRLEHALWGLNPSGYHWVNILLHAVNAVLLWGLLRRLALPGAWFAAAVFALHPVQAESVAWISELKNVQSMFFILLCTWAWLEHQERRAAARWYSLSLVFFACALFSKTTACTLPAAFLLMDWLRHRPLTWRGVWKIVPYLALGLVMGLVSMWWERNKQGTVGELYTLSFLERLLVATRALWFYLGKLLWPQDLTFNYPLWKINAAESAAYLWLGVTGIAACLVVWVRRRAGRGLEVGLLFFAATLGPLLGFIMLYTFRYTYVADHYQYVAMIGPVCLLAAGLARVLGRSLTLRAIYPWVVASVAVTLGVLTWRQSRMYKDLETLWATTVARNPTSYMGHNNLAAVYLEQDRVDAAIYHLNQALQILPGHPSSHYNLAKALLKKGDVPGAIEQLEAVLRSEPDDARALTDLSVTCLLVDRVADAERYARKLVHLHPERAEGHMNLGSALLRSGDSGGALHHYQKACDLEPTLPDAWYNLGFVQYTRGDLTAGIEATRRAVTLRPSFAQAHNNLGNMLYFAGDPAAAADALKRACDLEPANPEFRGNLGNALLAAGQAEEAVSALEAAVGLNSGNADLHSRLGWALAEAGRLDEAIARFRQVLAAVPDADIAYSNLAQALLRKGDPREALAQYDALLARAPDHPYALSDSAWVLSTWPDDAVRDVQRALDLAKRAHEISKNDAMVLRALAAAYANAGDFGQAAELAEQAMQIATSHNNALLAAELDMQLRAYRNGVPYRQRAALHPPEMDRADLSVQEPLPKA